MHTHASFRAVHVDAERHVTDNRFRCRITTPVEWAQRKTCIYVNIRVDELQDAVIKIDKNRLTFRSVACQCVCVNRADRCDGKNSGTGGVDKKLHELDLELFGEVKVEESKYMVRGRGAEIVLIKAEPDGPYWQRLLKESKKQHWLKVDFDKWQAEDESDDEAAGGLGGGGGGPAGGFGGGASFEDMMRQMGGLGGMGGMGGLGGAAGADLGEDFGEDDEDSDDEKLPELEEVADEKK